MTERKLIITTTDAGGGCLKQTKLADRVLVIAHEIIWGELPKSADLPTFLLERGSLLDDAEDWEPEWLEDNAKRLSEISGTLPGFDTIELWTDQTPNEQLIACQVIEWLGRQIVRSDRLHLVETGLRIGSQSPEHISRTEFTKRPLDQGLVACASQAWAAYLSPTPEAARPLAKPGAAPLPELATAFRTLLEELPCAETGLMRTQKLILEAIAQGHATPKAVLSSPLLVLGMEPHSTPFDYWRVGKLLVDLGRAETPAIGEMTERGFTLELHDDAARWDSFKNAKLELTSFGEALLDRRADFATRNKIDRWWGGTRLTNRQLWRWDDVRGELVPPG